MCVWHWRLLSVSFFQFPICSDNLSLFSDTERSSIRCTPDYRGRWPVDADVGWKINSKFQHWSGNGLRQWVCSRCIVLASSCDRFLLIPVERKCNWTFTENDNNNDSPDNGCAEWIELTHCISWHLNLNDFFNCVCDVRVPLCSAVKREREIFRVTHWTVSNWNEKWQWKRRLQPSVPSPFAKPWTTMSVMCVLYCAWAWQQCRVLSSSCSHVPE